MKNKNYFQLIDNPSATKPVSPTFLITPANLLLNIFTTPSHLIICLLPS